MVLKMLLYYGFALQSLLLCGFCGTSYMCWLNVTVFGFVMVSIIARKFIGALLETVNFTIPSLDDAR